MNTTNGIPTSFRMLPLLCLLLLVAGSAQASRRGPEVRVALELERSEAFTGEAYGARLAALEDGFVYFYALDADGYVNLLYPVLPEDGRGQVQAGDTLWIHPLYAGSEPGLEQLVAVHTREFRTIRSSRRHFLAPDPRDLTDIHARLTRSEKELDSYASVVLTVMATSLPEAVLAEEDERDTEVHVGVYVHNHRYDYWCPYCDCWHPACTHNHCWCGWEVVYHYHGRYRYHHCYLWGPWHGWWRPPMVYVYVRGGSPWDYDTRPWRSRRHWSEHRHHSDRWREVERPRMGRPEAWVEEPPRQRSDTPTVPDLRRKLAELDEPTPSRTPRVISTEAGNEAPAPSPGKPLPSVLSTGATRDAETVKPVPKPTTKPGRDTSKGTSKGKKKTPASPGKTPDAKPDAKPESKPEAKPDSKPEAKPQATPSQPAKPQPKQPKRPTPGPGA